MEAEVGDEQMGSDPTIWALCDRTRRAAGQGSRGVPAFRHDVQPGGDRHALPAGRGDPGARIVAHPVKRRRRSGSDRGRADQGTARRTRPVHRGYAGRGDPPGVALFADAAPRGGGADRQSRRRRVLERRCAARGHRCRACTRAVHAHGWRTADECRGGAGRAGDRSHRRLRFGVAGFHQGPGCTFGRRARRVARVHRPGMAMEAAARRLDASGRHVRRRLSSMRWSTTSIGLPRTTPTPSRWRAAWRRFPASRWRCRRPTWCSSTPKAPA